jgi:hypothetical protein
MLLTACVVALVTPDFRRTGMTSKGDYITMFLLKDTLTKQGINGIVNNET